MSTVDSSRVLHLLTLLVIVLACGAWYPASAYVQTDGIGFGFVDLMTSPVPKGVSVRELVAHLDASDTEIRTAAENHLKSLGRTSPNLRKEVISELLNAIQLEPELAGGHLVLSTPIFEFWESATNIILSLRITEAIDAMIACVHCSNGLAGSMGEPPAFIALTRMGTIAIPKLSRAILQEPDGYKRLRIVACLSAIGGPKAKLTLKNALSKEKDQTIREHILKALQ